MKKREIDSRCRNKDYTAKITLNHLPASDEQMSGILSFLDYVRERKDVSVPADGRVALLFESEILEY